MVHVRGSIRAAHRRHRARRSALRELAAGDPRIRFTGFLNDAELAEAYAGARAVLFAPTDEDYGYITLEAMLSAKPVVTTTDSGGPTELVEAGVDGADHRARPGRDRRRDQRPPAPPLDGGGAWAVTGERRARQVTWDAAVATLLDGVDA